MPWRTKDVERAIVRRITSMPTPLPKPSFTASSPNPFGTSSSASVSSSSSSAPAAQFVIPLGNQLQPPSYSILRGDRNPLLASSNFAMTSAQQRIIKSGAYADLADWRTPSAQEVEALSHTTVLEVKDSSLQLSSEKKLARIPIKTFEQWLHCYTNYATCYANEQPERAYNLGEWPLYVLKLCALYRFDTAKAIEEMLRRELTNGEWHGPAVHSSVAMNLISHVVLTAVRLPRTRDADHVYVYRDRLRPSRLLRRRSRKQLFSRRSAAPSSR